MPETNENAAVFFVDRHAGADYGRKPAFTESSTGKSISYVELSKESGKLADLYQRHGIEREDRVAMLLLDQIEFPIVFWGSLKAGVVPVPLNTLLATSIYEYILLDSRAKALFVSEELLPVVNPLVDQIPTLKKIFVVGDNPSSGVSFHEELARSDVREPINCSANECAFWLYSSGSTGAPKGVRHVHGSLKFTAETYGAQVLGIRQDDIVFSAAKMFFAYGLGNAMTFPMSVGASTILLCSRPTPESVFGVLNKYEPTVLCGIPTLYAAMGAAMEQGDYEVRHALRRCISAGEALPREVGLRWERHAGCEILDGVGSTEMLHIFVSNAPGDVEYGTSGKPVPGYELRLVNEEGNEVEIGEIGELLVRGESSAVEYWNMREKSRSTFEGWWTRTGDKYNKTDDGRYVYCGRSDDMFKVSGIWVSPFEIEQSLAEHPYVLEAAVVAHKDEEQLEKPKAFVVLKNGAHPDDLERALKDHVKNSIGKWKYPRWIEVVDELPKTATGKILRFKLKETGVKEGIC